MTGPDPVKPCDGKPCSYGGGPPFKDTSGTTDVKRIQQDVAKQQTFKSPAPPAESTVVFNLPKAEPQVKPVPKPPPGKIYHEPRAPFSILVSDGWTATETQGGVKLHGSDNAYAEVVVIKEGFSPSWYIESMQKDGFARKVIESGQAVLGGEPGVFMVYHASNAGNEGIFRTVVMSHNHHIYALSVGGRGQTFYKAKPDLERIEASFSVEMKR